jgi:peptidyl-prolyl cis-trans isomerase SurA
MSMKKITLSMAIFSFFATMIFAMQSHAMRIIAVVNDDVVTEIEFSNRMELVIKNSNLPPKDEVIESLKPQVLNALIEEKLQLQEAERLGIEITPEDIQKGLTTIAQQNDMSVEAFQKLMRKQGIPLSSLANQIKANMAWGQVVQQEIRPRIEITDADIEAQLERFYNAQGKQEFLISEIFLSTNTEEEAKQAKKLAQDLFTQIKAGKAKFQPVAQQFSQGAGASQGGLIGWVQEGQLPETVEAAAKQMEKGTVSPPIRSRNGYHIIWLQEKRMIQMDPDTNEMVLRSEIGNNLGMQRLEKQAKRYMTDLRSAAFIELRG